MKLGRGFTAVAQQVPRLAQGVVPLDSGLRASGAANRSFTAVQQRASRLAGLVELLAS